MSLLLYAVLVIGIMILFSSSMQSVLKAVFSTLHLTDKSSLKSIGIVERFQKLLLITLGEHMSNFTEVILLGNVLLAVFAFLVISINLSYYLGLVSCLAVLMAPYALIQVRLHSIRIESSYEGEFLITELINQYKLNGFNMIEAIDASIQQLTNSPLTRRLLFQMSIRLKSYRDRDELEKILREFTYGVNTQWSRMLTNNFMLSIEDGFDVTTGLVDIQNELKRAKTAHEKGSRNTAEGFIIIKVFIPGLYLFTLYIALKYFNFSLDKFIVYQLFTQTGMKLFIMNALLYIVNVMLMVLFTRRKFDIT